MKNANKDQKQNPYATLRGGRIEAPNTVKEQPASSVNRPSGDGRA